MSEADLIIDAQRGSEAAWATLVREHEQAVYRLAYLLLGDSTEAEDVAQEAFVRAFQAIDRFDTHLPLRPWLLSIAANGARNRRRAIGRYLGAIRKLVQARPEPVPAIAGASVAGLEAEVLWRAVRRLGAADQEIIYLRYFLDLSEAETSSALGVPSGTVKSRLHRALGRLRAVVEREFPGLHEGRYE